MAGPKKTPDGVEPAANVEFSPLSQVDKEMQRRKEFKKHARKAKRSGSGKGDLNINSLMDALTILLVFLLVSITSDPLNVKQDDYLLLARSTVDFSPGDDSIPILVTKKFIIVDNQHVADVKCTIGGGACTDEPVEGTGITESRPAGDIQAMAYCARLPIPDDCPPEEVARLNTARFKVDSSYKQDGDDKQFLIVTLHKKLQQLVKRQREENLQLNREFKGVTTIIADRDIPFQMLAEVVHTAGMAELGDIRFAVINTGTR